MPNLPVNNYLLSYQFNYIFDVRNNREMKKAKEEKGHI